MDTEKRILLYGDSNTYGTLPLWKASPYIYNRYDKDDRWPEILARKLGDGYKILEDGQPGRTTIYNDGTEPFARYCNGIDHLANSLMTNLPLDLVVIMLGTNDLHCLTPPTEETLGIGIERLIDEVRSFPECGYRNIAPPILVVAPPHFKKPKGRIEVFPKFHGEDGIRLSKLFGPVYQEVAKRKGCYFLDSSEYAEPHEADGVHFTKESHRIFADAIYKSIKGIIG
jgi:lysophospholipase L1-like esterase